MVLQSDFLYLKRQAFELLCGLLDEKSAEEFRALVASDVNVARVFDEVRDEIEFIRSVARCDDLASRDDVASPKNVSIASIAFDALPLLELDKTVENGISVVADQNIDSDRNDGVAQGASETLLSKKARKKEKKNKRKRAERLLSSENNSDPDDLKTRLEVGRRFLWSSIFGRVRRVWTLFLNSTLPTKLFITLFIVMGVTTSLAICAQEFQLKRYFREDFRIQAAIPRVLARGRSQSIVVSTSGITGVPKRVPVRFCFSDPSTNDFLLAHTDGGKVDGNIVYELPDLAEFPDEVLLSIYAGANEVAAFQSFLTVVNDDNTRDAHELEWKYVVNYLRQKTEVDKRDFSPCYLEVFDSVYSAQLDGNVGDSGEGVFREDDYPVNPLPTNETRELQEPATPFYLRLASEIGGLTENCVNRIYAYCYDDSCRPIARKFVLQDIDANEEIAFETSEIGVGSFEWAPRADASYLIQPSSDSDPDPALTSVNGETDASTVTETKTLRKEFPATFVFDADARRLTESFVPQLSSRDVTFSFGKRVLYDGDPVVLELTSSEKNSVIVALEKSDVVVAQKLATVAPGENKIEIIPPSDLHGLFTVAVYNCERTPFEKIGVATLYRKYNDSEVAQLSAKIEKTEDFNNPETLSAPQEQLLVETSNAFAERMKDKNQNWNELPMKLDVYALPNLESAIALLNLEEILETLSDELIEAFLVVSPSNDQFQPPVLFDNASTLKENVGKKLKAFQEYETKTSLWIVRLGFFGCLTLAVFSLYFVFFDVFSAFRGLSIILCACLFALFFFTLQRSLSFSFRATSEIVSSLEKTKQDSERRNSASTKRFSPLNYAEEYQDASVEIAAFKDSRLVSTKKIGLGTLNIPLQEIVQENDRGAINYIMIKLDDTKGTNWKILSIRRNESSGSNAS